MTSRAGSLALVVAGLVVLAAVGPARAQVDLKAAHETVLAQLDAFRRDDYDTAYTFASASIREMFDRAAFERMVRRGYPEIARSRSASIERSAVASHGRALLVVKIRGLDGNRVEAIYEMVREGGAWKIDGVVARVDDEAI